MVKKQLRHAHKSKDDRKQTKTTGLISKDTEVKSWPCVHQVYLVVQHGLVFLKISFDTMPHALSTLTGSDNKQVDIGA